MNGSSRSAHRDAFAVAAGLLLVALACGRNDSAPKRNLLDPAFFEEQIVAFEKADAESRPAEGVIVFVGSSSIRMWGTLAKDMAPLEVVNRGFGGAHLSHVIHNARRIVTPYRPSKVLVYAGDNDLAEGSPKTPEIVLSDYQELVELIHEDAPGAEIFFISIKPSLARWDRWPEMRRANTMVELWSAGDARLFYIDAATPLLAPSGEPRKDVFLEGGLHMNAKGYAEWTRVVRAELLPGGSH